MSKRNKTYRGLGQVHTYSESAIQKNIKEKPNERKKEMDQITLFGGKKQC